MAIKTVSVQEAVADWRRFDAVIDVRSPAEYAEDHLPGALNWPVLDDAQRAEVGTIYVQRSPLEARKLGAALVARNIADHIEQQLRELPRSWQPLVYCWRGGQRSGSLAWFLDQIGFRTHRLEGGYKAFRVLVREQLALLPARFDWHVLAGRTGSGKTRLLQALARAGAQALDLEGLACHRGSVLGALPGQPQPAQKRFDTLLWQALSQLDPARPVFVESESRKVGALQLPDALVQALHAPKRLLRLELGEAARVQLLLEEYDFFRRDAPGFCRLLEGLVALRGRERVDAWCALARAGQFAECFAALMREHYDPMYLKSMQRHFAGFDSAEVLAPADGSAAAMDALAQRLAAGAPGSA